MLAAVAPSQFVEPFGAATVGRKRGLEDVGLPAHPGQPAVLGGNVPAGKRPFPASSQQHNQHANQTIPYARRNYQWPEHLQRDLLFGDAVFVHRGTATGVAGPRFAYVTSVDMLNAALSQEQLRPSEEMPARAARAQLWDEQWQLHQYWLKDYVVSDEEFRAYKQKYINFNKDSPDYKTVHNMLPHLEWEFISELGDWTLDGTVLSLPYQHTNPGIMGARPGGQASTLLASVSHRGAGFDFRGNDDEPLLVAIQGAAIARNTQKHPDGAHTFAPPAQIFGEGLTTFDVAGIAVLWNYEKLVFELEPSTYAQVAKNFLDGARWKGYPGEFNDQQLVGFWKLGRVLDSSAVPNEERSVKLNVYPEFISLGQLVAMLFDGKECEKVALIEHYFGRGLLNQAKANTVYSNSEPAWASAVRDRAQAERERRSANIQKQRQVVAGRGAGRTFKVTRV